MLSKHTQEAIAKRKKRSDHEEIVRSLKNIIGALTVVIIVIVGFFLFVLHAGNALDKTIDNQNISYCESALNSKNQEWLDKCSYFYETGKAEYLRYEN